MFRPLLNAKEVEAALDLVNSLVVKDEQHNELQAKAVALEELLESKLDEDAVAALRELMEVMTHIESISIKYGVFSGAAKLVDTAILAKVAL